VANVLNNLAGLHRESGEHEKALALFQRSLEINLKVRPLSYNIVPSIHNIMPSIHNIMP
jgi:hypothetical protein